MVGRRGAVVRLGDSSAPFTLSVTTAELEPLPTAVRDVDVSLGRASHRKRVRAGEVADGAPDIRFEGGIYAEPTDRSSKLADSWFGIMAAKLRGDPPGQGSSEKLGREAYRLLLARSKMALSVREAGTILFVIGRLRLRKRP